MYSLRVPSCYYGASPYFRFSCSFCLHLNDVTAQGSQPPGRLFITLTDSTPIKVDWNFALAQDTQDAQNIHLLLVHDLSLAYRGSLRFPHFLQTLVLRNQLFNSNQESGLIFRGNVSVVLDEPHLLSTYGKTAQ